MRRRTTDGRGSDAAAAMPVVLGLVVVVVVAACGGGSSSGPGVDPSAGDASSSGASGGTSGTSGGSSSGTSGGSSSGTSGGSSSGAPTDGGASNDASPGQDASVRDGGPSSIWHPKPGTSWQWQLSGTVDTTVNVQMYDIDLFDNTPQTIASLQAAGRKVICYFDMAYEPNRPDSAKFTPAVLGNGVVGWPGEKWVDIRTTVIKDIMTARMDLAVQKGCDGVEPDNMDVYQNNPGFPITAADQLAYAQFIAGAAHARNLSVALKNDVDQVAQLVSFFDFTVNEECFKFSECATLKPFIDAGKAVFQVEYGTQSLVASVCPQAIAADFDTLIKNLNLDAARISCR